MKCFVLIGLFLLLSSPLFGQEKAQRKDNTSFDFESSAIDGKNKAPTGFFIRSRSEDPRLKKMVKLRSNFKERILNTSYPVRNFTQQKSSH